jgi:hypothetical protein
LNARRSNQGGAQKLNPEKICHSDHKTFVDGTTLLHIKTVTSLIEGRPVALKDIITMITAIMRQLSIDKRKRFTYVKSYLGKIPP